MFLHQMGNNLLENVLNMVLMPFCIEADEALAAASSLYQTRISKTNSDTYPRYYRFNTFVFYTFFVRSFCMGPVGHIYQAAAAALVLLQDS